MNKDILIRAGIDYDTGVSRCMGNAEFYEKMLNMLPGDPVYAQILQAYEAGDNAALKEAVHDFKGMCGNLSVTLVYEATVRMMTVLRSEAPTRAQIQDALARLCEEYEKAVQAIGQAI